MRISSLAKPLGPTEHGRSGSAGRGFAFRGLAALTVAALLGAATGGAAQADDIYNTIDGITAATAIDIEAEVMPLAYGGDAGTTTLRVQARNSGIDGFEGCNMNKGPVTFALQSSNPAVATVEPTTVQFTACTPLNGPVQEKVLTVKPVGAGSATITATVVVNPSPGSFNTAPATFRVDVAPPPNSPPAVTVVNVDAGGHYIKGAAVPTPMCRVVDVEDGTFEFAPVMSRPAPQLPDGLGERLAKCTYTDTRGATAVSSASYFIEDGDAPTVRYILSEPAPANGWYRHEIALDWVVTEPQSPGTLVTQGCERQWVTADQDLTAYTCTATSAGGSTTKTSEAIRKDATAPVVTGTIESPSVVVNGLTWYNAAPSIRWDVSDAVSGVLEGSVKQAITVSGEGRNKMARTVATDNAGNTGGGSVQYINIDASAPAVQATLASTPAYVADGKSWFADQATVDVTASDPEVQPFERGSGLKDDPTGSHDVTTTSSFTATATDHVGNSATSNAVPVSIDSAAPVVSVTCPKLPIIQRLPVKVSWTASDEATGSGLKSAKSGTVALDTATVGRKTLTAPTATDNVGHPSAPATCGYQVVYAFIGFAEPVDNFGVYNKVKAGSAVPLKFTLLGDQGMNILSGAPVVSQVACPGAMKVDSLEQTASSKTPSGLSYDRKTTLYTYTWKTATSMAGTCQKVTVTLVDGSSKSALFTFTR